MILKKKTHTNLAIKKLQEVTIKNLQLTPSLMVKNCMLSPKIWNKARMATVTISIQLCTEHLSQVNRTRKRKKSHTNCKERDKNVLIHK